MTCGMVGRICAAASKSRRITAVWYLVRARVRVRAEDLEGQGSGFGLGFGLRARVRAAVGYSSTASRREYETIE